MDHWNGLKDLLASLEYWSEVQKVLAEAGMFETPAPLFGSSYLTDGYLVIPRGPGNAEDSDGYTDYAIREDNGVFSLRITGRTRAVTFDDVPEAWFSEFPDIAKYFVASYVANETRSRFRSVNLEIVRRRWQNIGPAPRWSQTREPNPAGFDRAVKYFQQDRPERYYFTLSTDSDTSYLLDLSWRELTSTFTEGISGIEHVRLPSYTDE